MLTFMVQKPFKEGYMKISQMLSEAVKPYPSLEIVPPQKGVTKTQLLDSIRPFMEFNPPFVNVTTHRDEYEFIPQTDGSYRRALVRKRVSETAVCAAIQSEFKIEVVPHIICGGASREIIESRLHDFQFLGVENLLALRGDSITGEKRFVPDPDGYKYASELVEAIAGFSKDRGYEFCVGVGAYPEKHFEAPNIELDINNLKKKVNAGASFIVTQMFFDNRKFYNFVFKCRAAGITVPIIPGLKPLSNLRQLELLPRAFSIDIPLELTTEMRAHADDPEVCYRIGKEWCSAQCRDLLAHGCKTVHFYTMGRSDNIVDILRDNF